MARTLTINERRYNAGTYGPYSVDSFTQNNSDRLVLHLTQVDWPNNGQPIMRVRLAWSNGSVAEYMVSGVTPDINTGLPRPSVPFVFDIPKIGGTKVAVASGTVTIEVFQSIRTAVQLGAE